jgi:hypothetical protein
MNDNKRMLAEMTKKMDASQAEIRSGQAEMRAIIKAWSSDLKSYRKRDDGLPGNDGGAS